MALELYNKKRNFEITPEPPGKVVERKGKTLSFVIQKHRASHMHYDFRLELNGVLLSWAVPKGPSLDPSVRRLAMQTEDHPIEYGGFEGIIPPKQYGAGTVLLWDRGTWQPKGDADADYSRGRLKFTLQGDKLHGGWMLVRGSKGGKYGENAWFLIKERDEFAKPEAEGNIVEERPESVATGRLLEEIADDPDRVWHSNKSVADNVKSGAVKKKRKLSFDLEKLAGSAKRALPERVDAELATLVKEAPAGGEWLHEMKLDGYRMLTRIEKGTACMLSRNGKDWTDKFATIARTAARLPVETAWLDGEVVVMASDGRTSFQALQNVLAGENAAKLHYFVFDLLYLNGHDLRRVPLVERKKLLERLLESAPASIRCSAHVQGRGDAFLKEACNHKLEGIISKRAQSAYVGGRCRDWLKVKCSLRQELVIGGYTDPQGSRTGFGALLLGVYEEDGSLSYSGKVGTGFNEATLGELYRKVKALETKTPAFSNPPRGYEAKGAHWIRPELVAEIEFTEWTNDATLRHPSFQGLREDKKASEVRREQAVATEDVTEDAPARKNTRRQADSAAEETAESVSGRKAASKRARKKSAAAAKTSTRARAESSDEAARTPAQRNAKTSREAEAAYSDGSTVAGVRLSNPDKLLYPEDGITKRELAGFYEHIAEWILPHLKDRPLTLVRCPNGWSQKCFYQKHPDPKVDPIIERVTVRESSGDTLYMMANSVSALVAILQMGALELHPFGSSRPKLGCPDRITFDFDPADDVGWNELVEAVHLLKTLLEQLELESFIKTTGGKGLHVVLPITPTLGWDDIKSFTKAVAELMVRSFPDRYVATVSKAKRHGKIFVDYLRNGEGATAVSAYSLRARAHAPVATPIAWDELGEDIRREHFNVRNVPERLASMKTDPWADFFKVDQAVTKAMMRKVGAG
jgi:bifunctional non-homologous end joining protein LigD